MLPRRLPRLPLTTPPLRSLSTPTPTPARPATIRSALLAMSSGRLTSASLTRSCLDAAHASRALNAFVTLTPDTAEAEARASDERRARGLPPRALEGVPVAVKDNFCTRGVRTTAGSRMLESFVPPHDATVVERLREAGAVLVGKTNMDEFSMGSGSTTSAFGPVVSPLGEGRVPGGSSGGSAAAVAAGACLAALGSDTGGSIRLPAAYCGLAGLKPTYGLVSRYGLVAYASSLDAPSVVAGTASCAYAVLRALAGTCERDATSRRGLRPLPAPDDADAPGRLDGVRVGVPAEFGPEELPAEARDAWEAGAARMEAAGAEIVRGVSLPAVRAALPAYYILASAEAMSNLARYDGIEYGRSAAATDADLDAAESLHALLSASRGEGFGPEVRRRILLGSFVTSSRAYSSYVEKAQRVRRLVADQFAAALGPGGAVDLLLTPTATSTAPTVRALAEAYEADPVGAYLNDVMTVPANLAGVPALSVRAAESASDPGMPLGLQLMAAPLGEALLSRAGRVLEVVDR